MADKVHEAIRELCEEMGEFLVDKNKAYGNSFMQPCNIFSGAEAKEQLAVRIDDKLNRIAKGSEYPGDDTVKDLAGYCILWLVMEAVGAEEIIE